MKTTYTEHKKKLTIHPFPYIVYIVVSNDIMESRDRYKKQLGEYNGVPADGMHVCFENRPIAYLFLKYDTTIDTVVHEVFHAIWGIFNYIGARPEEEVMAYHLGAVTEAVVTFLAKTERELDKVAKSS